MDAVISVRCSLRYTEQAVPETLVREIIAAALCGNRCDNVCLWDLIVISDHKVLCQIPRFHISAGMLVEVPVAVVVCTDLSSGVNKDVWLRECSSLGERIVVAAIERNLGAIRLSIYPVEERIEGMSRLLGLPKSVLPISLIPIGYPKIESVDRPNHNPPRIHVNHW